MENRAKFENCGDGLGGREFSDGDVRREWPGFRACGGKPVLEIRLDAFYRERPNPGGSGGKSVGEVFAGDVRREWCGAGNLGGKSVGQIRPDRLGREWRRDF